MNRFDAVVGNPPWANFSVLPSAFRKVWGDKYLEYGLVKTRKDVLLGGSRADIATLILKKVIDKNLIDGGAAIFFIPLSIFFNSGSNDLFRPYPGSLHRYAVKEIWDFADEKIFSGIATRYGAARFAKSDKQVWPVLTHVRENGKWVAASSTSSDSRQGFWQRHDAGTSNIMHTPKIRVSEGHQPRQGLNTCGANNILLFTKDGDLYRNGSGDLIDLEEELMFPLIDKSIFSDRNSDERFVLVPHDKISGRPLGPKQLALYPNAQRFLNSKRDVLENRKGAMLNAHMKRGFWWALLGVGPYSFAPWKVVWEALGKRAFKPRVVPGRWQGNQALHAFCPCDTEEEAKRLAEALLDPAIEAYLLASAMGGTMNWAQPGRVGKLFVVESTQHLLFA